MRIISSLIRLLAVMGLGLVASNAHAVSYSELFEAVPTPPKDIDIAKSWMQNGVITAPAYIAFQARLKAEKDAIAAGQAQVAAKSSVPPEQDSPAVMIAVNGYKTYAAANSGDLEPAKVLGKRTAWLYGRFTKIPLSTPVIKLQQSAAELDAYQALFKDWKTTHARTLSLGDTQIAGAGDPAAIKSGANLQAVEQYRAAMIGEIEALLSITATSVKRAYDTQAAIDAGASAKP